MKNILIIAILFLSTTTFAQDAQKQAMEDRAKEMIRVLALSDKEAYRKFIKANYTEALINKKMRLNVQGGPDGPAPESEKTGSVEDKVNLYSRLHDDLGEVKMVVARVVELVDTQDLKSCG